MPPTLRVLRPAYPHLSLYPLLSPTPLPPPSLLVRDQLRGFGSSLAAAETSPPIPSSTPDSTSTSKAIPFQRNPPPKPSPSRSSSPSPSDSKSSEPNPNPNPNSTPEPSPEAEVSDREWEMRVATAMLHLRETLPRIFEDDTADLFPPDIYSQSVVLKLPHPFPLKIGSLHGYRMAFGIAKNGMQALHTDLSATIHRLTFTPTVPPSQVQSQSASQSKPNPQPPQHRQKQLRILLSVQGTSRLHGLHPKQAEWHTSSLYTFNPYSGLIGVHEVETIRPLPGEGVAEWVLARLGLRTAVGGVTAGVGCVRQEGE